MDPGGPGGPEIPGNSHGIGVINGHLGIVALVKADSLTAVEVNCGINQHGASSFTARRRP